MFASKRNFKLNSVDSTECPHYQEPTYKKVENVKCNPTQRSKESETRNYQSNQDFFRKALKGDRLGQKAMNELRLK